MRDSRVDVSADEDQLDRYHIVTVMCDFYICYT